MCAYIVAGTKRAAGAYKMQTILIAPYNIRKCFAAAVFFCVLVFSPWCTHHFNTGVLAVTMCMIAVNLVHMWVTYCPCAMYAPCSAVLIFDVILCHRFDGSTH